MCEGRDDRVVLASLVDEPQHRHCAIEEAMEERSPWHVNENVPQPGLPKVLCDGAMEGHAGRCPEVGLAVPHLFPLLRLDSGEGDASIFLKRGERELSCGIVSQ